MNKKNLAFLLFIAMSFFNTEAFAANAGALNLAVTTWLMNLLDEVSGPWVYIFAGLAGIGALFALLWNPSEISGFLKVILVVVIVCAFMVIWVGMLGDSVGASATIDEVNNFVSQAKKYFDQVVLR